MSNRWRSSLVLVSAVLAGLSLVIGCDQLTQPPKITAECRWQFQEGRDASGWAPPSPNRWTIHLRLRSDDSRPWTLAPDLLVAEASGTDVLANAVVLPDRLEPRNASVPYGVDALPDDDSGEAYRQVLFPAGGDRYTVIMTSAEAHLKVADEEGPWQAVEITRGGELAYEWEVLTGTTFTEEVKSSDAFRLLVLGPVVYRHNDPSASAYLLSSRAGGAGEDGTLWQASSYELIPLTRERILEEANDTSRSVEWRAHFLVMLWDQPRPVVECEEILANVLCQGSYPLPLRQSAARGLMELGALSAKDTILAMARDGEVDDRLRRTILAGLHLLLNDDEVEAPSFIAGDSTEDGEVRKAALRCLSSQGPTAWEVIDGLRGDPQVGELAEDLINRRSSDQD